jgi:hypothetical protein
MIYSKNFVYYLGFLWSDGTIERYRTVLEILEEDALDIVENIKSINFLNICTMKRTRKNRKPQMSIYFCDSKFYDDYQSKYFIDKSFKSPISLLNNIPNDLIRYFYLGLIDGDGCFYFNEKNKIRQFYITSCYEQDWTHIENLFKHLNIKQYEVRRVVNKRGNKSSYIRVKKYQEIVYLYQYLYPNGYEMGLKRKFNKCKSIVDAKPKNLSNKSKIDIDILRSKINEGLDIIDVAKHFECNWRKIYNLCKTHKLSYNKGFFKRTKIK